MPEVRLPDGTLVQASSIGDWQAADHWRDFGLYLDPVWEPDWPASLISWPDFGLPTCPDDALHKIMDAYERALEGQRVEVGCLGGLGRTGTVLACLCVLSGMSPSSSIASVRCGYDRRAIETAEQEQWVVWFASRVAESRSKG